ncbi:hypothetical protein ES703_72177 [subsurface metagenome]
MSKQSKKVQCPGCQELFTIELDIPELPSDLLTRKDIEGAIKDLQPKPKDDNHKHKTADEFLDCPECRLWVDKTAKKYKITPLKELTDEQKKEVEAQLYEFGSFRRKKQQ